MRSLGGRRADDTSLGPLPPASAALHLSADMAWILQACVHSHIRPEGLLLLMERMRHDDMPESRQEGCHRWAPLGPTCQVSACWRRPRKVAARCRGGRQTFLRESHRDYVRLQDPAVGGLVRDLVREHGGNLVAVVAASVRLSLAGARAHDGEMLREASVRQSVFASASSAFEAKVSLATDGPGKRQHATQALRLGLAPAYRMERYQLSMRCVPRCGHLRPRPRLVRRRCGRDALALVELGRCRAVGMFQAGLARVNKSPGHGYPLAECTRHCDDMLLVFPGRGRNALAPTNLLACAKGLAPGTVG